MKLCPSTACDDSNVCEREQKQVKTMNVTRTDGVALPSEGRGQGFESLRVHQSSQALSASKPRNSADLAQLPAQDSPESRPRAADFQSVAFDFMTMGYERKERQTTPGGSSTWTEVVKPQEGC